MDFFDLPGYGEGGTVDPRPITVHKIAYRMHITKEMLIFEDMMHPNYHGPLTKEETEYREYEESREDLDLYEEDWE